jgi:hypothetical protein
MYVFVYVRMYVCVYVQYVGLHKRNIRDSELLSRPFWDKLQEASNTNNSSATRLSTRTKMKLHLHVRSPATDTVVTTSSDFRTRHITD